MCQTIQKKSSINAKRGGQMFLTNLRVECDVNNAAIRPWPTTLPFVGLAPFGHNRTGVSDESGSSARSTYTACTTLSPTLAT